MKEAEFFSIGFCEDIFTTIGKQTPQAMSKVNT